MSATDTTRVTAEALPEISNAPISQRVEDLMRQLSEALADWHDQAAVRHTFVAQVPSIRSGAAYLMTNEEWRAESAEKRLTHHAREFAKAAQEIDPTATEFWMGRSIDSMPGGPRFTVVASAPCNRAK